ncbi:MAG: hypothetical protein JWP03_3937 [Phycisphaerales bacterium]|jgi:hypothetical protein|nr:hypothetical protein [Phycisphaerales bacterium]
MTLITNPGQARDRVAKAFFEVLHQTLPDTPQPGTSYPDLVGRARILQDTIFSAFLDEYGLSARDASMSEDDSSDRNGAD